MRVQHRHVIYVQGYDPRGLAAYYRMFCAEYKRTCALYGLAGEVARPDPVPERYADRWSTTTSGAGWQTKTTYDFLRWDDVIRRDFARPTWWKLLRMVTILLHTLGTGLIWRFVRAHWRFAAFMLYPLAILLLQGVLAVLLGALAHRAAGAFPTPVPELLGLAAVGVSVVFLLRLTERRTHLLYLCDDIATTHQFAHQRRPDWEERFEAFAAYVVEVARTTTAQEIVIVGHSSGSFVAVDVLDRALARDPHLGRHGPRVALLTVGANLPIIGFNPKAQWFRDRLARLAIEPSIAWVDYQSRHDVMSFWPFDPISGHGITLTQERHNPTVIAISFRDLWALEGLWGRRFHVFRAHFQFLSANERPGSAYDYYLICCGPFDLVTRATKPTEVAVPIQATQALPSHATSAPH